MENHTSVDQALSVIQRGTWVSAILVAAFMMGGTWLGFHVRARVLSRFKRTHLVNSLSAIGFLLLFGLSSYLQITATEPAAQLEACLGVYCLPPTGLQLLLPLVAGILTGVVYLMRERARRMMNV